MDDDLVLQELGAELERDDPDLAAMLRDTSAPPRWHGLAWTLLVTGLLGVGLLLAPAVTLGVLAMLLVIGSPLLACWWGSVPGDGPAPRST